MMYIPEGFAHGYLVLSDTSVFQYKCTNFYHPDDEFGIIWNDKQLNIDWSIHEPVLSHKDINLPNLKGINRKYLPKY